MRRFNVAIVGGLVAALAAGSGACKKSTVEAAKDEKAADKAPSPSKPANAPTQPPRGQQPESTSDGSLALTGIRFDVPEGWRREVTPPSAMGPKAVFVLDPIEGDDTNCSVRITYFPGMKGKDDMNIDRWLGQVKRKDGLPSTRNDARIEALDLGAVQATVVDVTGVVSSGRGMGGPSTDTPDQRMIAAVVNHPKGPHFVKAVGGVATMKKWQASIDAFLRSGRVE